MSELFVRVSPGELLDRISILRIKSARIHESTTLASVLQELELLERTWQESCHAHLDVNAQAARLQAVNERLWDLENRIREKEHAAEFDAEFVALARSVYLGNDERSELKRRINAALGSTIVEQKVYATYTDRIRRAEGSMQVARSTSNGMPSSTTLVDLGIAVVERSDRVQGKRRTVQ